MGIEDREWYRDAQAQRLRRAPASPSGANLPPGLRWGHAGIVAFWLALAGVLYAAFSVYLQPKAARVTADGELVIPRHRDGHFYVEGRVNGTPVTFMVDTGASLVTVSEGLARRAGLAQGEPTTFHTANGKVAGRRVRGVEVSAGPLSKSSTSVGVGLAGGDDSRALLGQGFLSEFEMTVSRTQLVLRRPSQPGAPPSQRS